MGEGEKEGQFGRERGERGREREGREDLVVVGVEVVLGATSVLFNDSFNNNRITENTLKEGEGKKEGKEKGSGEKVTKIK